MDNVDFAALEQWLKSYLNYDSVNLPLLRNMLKEKLRHTLAQHLAYPDRVMDGLASDFFDVDVTIGFRNNRHTSSWDRLRDLWFAIEGGKGGTGEERISSL